MVSILRDMGNAGLILLSNRQAQGLHREAYIGDQLLSIAYTSCLQDSSMDEHRLIYVFAASRLLDVSGHFGLAILILMEASVQYGALPSSLFFLYRFL